MSNVNIGPIALSNTFFQWVTIDNNIANSVNNLRNSNYVKDNGSFILANGSLQVTQTSGTGLAITNNVLFSQLTTMNTLITTGAASIGGNLTVLGSFIIDGNTLYTTDTLILRNGLASNGNGQIVILQGTGGNGNAVLQYYEYENVWRMTSNSNTPVTNGWQTVITNTNISDVWTSNSKINLATANILNGVYAIAQTALAYANGMGTYANGTVIVTGNNANVNFNNTATINVSAAANGSTQANVSFSVNTTAIGSFAAYGQANASYGQANAAYVQANAAYAHANIANATANLAYAEANSALTDALNAYAEANSAYALANAIIPGTEGAYATANAAYAEANIAWIAAVDAYGQANIATGVAESAYGEANSAYALAESFETPNQRLTGNGYVTLPGGAILQWGANNITAGTTAIPFPLQFPNLCFSVVVSPYSGIGEGAPAFGVSDSPAISRSGFSTYLNGVAMTIFWQAIGY